MSAGRQAERLLAPEIEAVIARVLDAADLDWTDGREEVEQELRAHFEDGLAGGTPATALLESFGDPEATGRRIARTRARRGRPGSAGPWQRPGDALRSLRRVVSSLTRAPAFTAIVILTLGLGVGANTAVFTVLDAVLLQDLPYAEPDRLVRVYEGRTADPTMLGFFRAPIFREYRSWDDVFESLAAIYTYREVGADLTDRGEPVRVTVVRVSAGYFETLGVAPLRGRTFLEEESYGPGEPRSTADPINSVAIVSHQLWRDHFEGDAGLVGRTIRLDDAPFEVVGVLPEGFQNPFGPQGDVWVPQDLRLGGSNNFNNSYLSAVGRLHEGLSVEAAQERAEVLSAAYGEVEAEASYQRPHILPLQDDVVGATRARMLWILAAAALLVLLTACLNVANLVVARGLDRDRQLALQSALGSGRARLVGGILLENGLLALLGGAAGVLLGWLGLRGLLLVAPDALPLRADLGMGVRAFGLALGAAVLSLLVFGLAPALRLSRVSPVDVLRSGDRASTTGRAARRVRDGLVVVQVAAALVLVTGAVLLTRSFGALVDVPLAIEPDGVLTFEVNLPTARYPDGASRQAFHERLHDRVRELGGVEGVGAVSWLPVQGRYHEWGFSWDTEIADGASNARWNPSDVRVIAGDYFDVMGIDLLRGPAPAEIDYEGEPVLWINETLVTEVFGGVDPIGRVVWMNGAARRVVGIVEDVPYGARGETSRMLYLPHAQFSDNRNWALIQVIRTQGDPTELQAGIRAAIAELDGQLVLHRPSTFADVLAGVRAQDRFATVLMSAFAALALLLSVLGTYGVVAGNVSRRTREIGIRMALGADAGRVRRLVLRYAAVITVPGVALGLAAAWLASRWIDSLLFGVESRDPATYATAVAVFVAVGLVAAWLPAERATRVDTSETLSAE